MQGTKAFKVPEHVSFVEMTDEAVLLDMEKEVFFGLNDVGTVVWKRMMSGPPPVFEDLVQAVEAEFDGTSEQIEADVHRFLGQLQSRGLVQPA
jgi:hypothetical protein